MIRLVLFSGDPKLQRLLAPALGPDYSVLVESNPSKLKQFVADGHVDVLILDVDNNYSSLEQQVAFFDEVRESRVPVVVMTDDSRRATVLELLQRGIYDYLHKPPSLPELNDYRCILHAHAEDSTHTGGTLLEMLGDAKQAGVSAILLTDHYRPPRDFIDGRWRGMRNGVLFIPGSEVRGFLVYPMLSSLWISFFDWDGLSATKTFVGLGNYAKLFFADEVAGPLGLEFWIGLPEAQEARVSPMIQGSPFLEAITDRR